MILSITILSYRNPALLRLCLKSLALALSKSPIEYEVIVVDNASTPETREAAEEFNNKLKNLSIIPLKENGGYTKGVNVGLKAAKGKYILSLNHDIVVPEGAIEKLLDFAKQNKHALIGPELLNFDGTHQDSYFRYYSPLTVLYRRKVLPLPFTRRVLENFLMRETDTSKTQSPNWISGAAFLTSRESINRVGYLDENLFHYFSDIDWSRRFWENGYQVVYYPEAKIFHYLGRASKGKFWLWDLMTNKTSWWHTMDGLKYFKKYGFFRKEYFAGIFNFKHKTS